MVAIFRSAWRRALATGEFQSSDGSIGENGCAAACGVTFDLQSPPWLGTTLGGVTFGVTSLWMMGDVRDTWSRFRALEVQ
jgi:hypothetical protein